MRLMDTERGSGGSTYLEEEPGVPAGEPEKRRIGAKPLHRASKYNVFVICVFFVFFKYFLNIALKWL